MARVGKTIVLLSGNMLLYQGEAFLIVINQFTCAMPF